MADLVAYIVVDLVMGWAPERPRCLRRLVQLFWALVLIGLLVAAILGFAALLRQL